MENTIILGGLVVIFLLVIFLLIQTFNLKKKLHKAEVDTLEQINLTIKSIDSEVQQIKKDFYQTIDKSSQSQ